MLLHDKIAVVYGAGGAVGSTVAAAFARDGAQVFLAGRTLDKVRKVAEQITGEGGTAEAAQVDARDEQAVERHVADVVGRAGRIDVLFNAIGMEDIQGTSLLDMPFEDFEHPVATAARTQFLTARAVARRMVARRSGVIMTITAEPSPAANLGGFMPACSLVEGLWRSLAVELGPHNVRTVVVRSAGSPDAPGVEAVSRMHAENNGAEFDDSEWGSHTMFGRLPRLAEVAGVATLLASDRASAVTGAISNVTCGAFVDL
ncbi:MAG TPA: SDR family oxidoreductase [Pseudonocardiaceae bacterium]